MLLSVMITNRCYAFFRPLPGRELVEGFIKAFYLNERDLERWIKEHAVSFHISNQFSSAGLVGF